MASDSKDSREIVWRKISVEGCRWLQVRTLDCNRASIREGVAMTISGFSDIIVLDGFGV